MTNVQCKGQSDSGIIVGQRSVLERCVVRDVSNGGLTSGYGIFAAEDAVIRDCEMLDNRVAGSVGPATGISAGTDSIIEHCKVTSRGTVGVAFNGFRITLRDSRVTMLNAGATCMTSIGTASVSDNQFSAFTGTAIQLGNSSGSTIIRNHILDGTPFAGTSLPNNIIGPIASNGNPTASTNPHANFVN